MFLKNALFKNNKNEAPKWIWEVLKTEVSHETNIQEIKSRLGRLIYDSRVVFGGNDNDLTDALKRMIQADGEDGILRAEA
ncbi:MAG: hypothetical protein IPK76_21960 [Lewinellaceae bacterium]|nr:hypothetical protein [Lewinellaceae bacterium]